MFILCVPALALLMVGILTIAGLAAAEVNMYKFLAPVIPVLDCG